MKYCGHVVSMTLNFRTVLIPLMVLVLLLSCTVSTGAVMPSLSVILGSINGHVYDDLNNPLSGVTVTLSDISGVKATATTDSSGYYQMTAGAGASLSLNASKQGYVCTDGLAVILSAKNPITHDLHMQRLPLGTVTADRPYVYADGSDAIWINVRVLDATGQPFGKHSVSFRLDKMGQNNWYPNEGHLSVDPPYLGIGENLDENGMAHTKYGWVPPGGAGTSQTITVYWSYPDTKIGSVTIQIRAAPTPTPTPTPPLPPPNSPTPDNNNVVYPPTPKPPTPSPDNPTSTSSNLTGVDNTPPVTTISLDGVQANGVYTSDVTVTLSASDNDSGVRRTEYGFDAISWVKYTDPFTISENGNKTFPINASSASGFVRVVEVARRTGSAISGTTISITSVNRT